MTGSSKHEKHSGLSISTIKEMMHFMDHREHKTDFVQTGCGFMFYENADSVRFSCNSESRFYKSKRSFIESYYDQSN